MLCPRPSHWKFLGYLALTMTAIYFWTATIVWEMRNGHTRPSPKEFLTLAKAGGNPGKEKIAGKTQPAKDPRVAGVVSRKKP